MRPARPTDLEPVWQLITACDVADVGEPDYTLADVESDWSRPRFELARDAVVIEGADGAIGYAAVRESIVGVELSFDTYVHPDHRGGELEERLIDWVVQRGEQRAAAADGAGLLLRSWPVEGSPEARLLEQRGFRVVRWFLRMVRELDGEVEPPTWPERLTVREFHEDDARAAHAAVDEAFADHWDHHSEPFEEWAERILEHGDHDPSLWWLALDGTEIAGSIRSVAAGGLSSAWIHSLAVRRPWRRRGLALALLLHAFAGLRQRGAARVALGVDADNLTGARRLYERAGMQVAIAWPLFEREARPR